MGSDELQAPLRISEKLLLHYARKSLSYFLQNVTINSQPEPRRFGEAAERWQRELIAPKIAAFEHVAGLSRGYTGPRLFMDILPRGHDKSSLEARFAMWLVDAAVNPVRGYIVAADKDQAKLVIQAAEEEKAHNPWLQVEITKDAITGRSGTVGVVAADAASAYGLRGDFFILDELTHWKNQKVWTAIMSGRHKRPSSLVCILSNAGMKYSWQHDLFLQNQKDPSWVVFYRHGTLAQWLKPEDIANDRKRLPPSEARRLIDNDWIDPAEEHDYLRSTEIDGCEELGRSLGLFYRLRRDPGVENYVGVVDYGARRDRCVMAIMHQDEHDRTRIDKMDVWDKGGGKMVSPERVRQWIEDNNKLFTPQLWVLDEWQMLATIEWMEKNLIPVESFNFRGGQGNYAMAQALRSVIVDRQMVWYPGCGRLGDETLKDELVALVVKKMSYGFRFDHENQRHDDRACVLGIGALTAPRFPWMPPTGGTPKVIKPLANVRFQG